MSDAAGGFCERRSRVERSLPLACNAWRHWHLLRPYLCRRLFLAQALFPVIHLSIAPLHSQCCSGQPSGFLSVCFCALVCIVLPHWAGHPTGIRNQLGRLLSGGERGPLPASSSRTQAVEPQRQVKSEKQKERRARPQLPKQRSTQAGAGWLGIIQLGSE